MNLESIRLRCQECGDCWLWRGSICNQSSPVVKVGNVNKSVRRMVYEQAKGKSQPPKTRLTTVCRSKRCVAPDHVLAKSPAWIAARCMADVSNTATHRAKISKAKTRTSRLSDADVASIRASALSSAKEAAQWGVSAQYVRSIRRGEYRVDFSNPFAGLAA